MVRTRATAAGLAVAALAAAVLSSCGSGADGASRASAAGAAAQVAAAPVGDSEAAASYALPPGVHPTEKAPAPGSVQVEQQAPAAASPDDGVSPGAPSDAEVRRELKQLEKVQARAQASGSDRSVVAATVDRSGMAHIGPSAPEVIQRVIAGGNAIAKFPYVYGGGHGSFVDTAYDCSASVSYALAAAGLLDAPKVSGELAHSGDPGPGRWITIYANEGHVFMYVAGLRFDTSGRAGPLGSRWQTAPRSLKGFAVRHPPGL